MKAYMNQIIEGNCVEVMRGFEPNSIDLTITSPPYDNLRTYTGFEFPFEEIAQALFGVTKKGALWFG